MPPGVQVLRRLGLERAVAAAGAPSFQGITFGLAGEGSTDIPFPTHPSGRSGLGVRRLAFDDVLAGALACHPRIWFSPDTVVRAVIPTAGEPLRVETAAGEVRVRFVVAADGLRSSIRQQQGWTRGPFPPQRYGVVGHWQTEAPVDPWVRITADRGLEVYDGPVAGRQRLVALLCGRQRMREFAGNLTAHYREVGLALRPGLRDAALAGQVQAVGPFNYRASTVAAEGVFLVGDAAGFVDPISGEGLAAGLRQALAFSEAIQTPTPEATYRRQHRRQTASPRLATALLVRLAASPARTERAVRGMSRAPGVMPTLLGALLGYWGLRRLSPRQWMALLTGY
jgi:2-polyprenyl-6-methoxyphenol hydroxylase-like FAD-dependent oxidoreductase